jgi:hypothetical protein
MTRTLPSFARLDGRGRPSLHEARSLATLGMTAAGSRFAHARSAPSLFVFDVYVLGVDYAFVFLLLGVAIATWS